MLKFYVHIYVYRFSEYENELKTFAIAAILITDLIDIFRGAEKNVDKWG